MDSNHLTHWGLMAYIWVGNLTINGSDNGLWPGWHQAIIWTNAGILLIGHLGTNFSKILIKIHIVSFKTMHLRRSAKWQPFCVCLVVLINWYWNSRKWTGIFKGTFWLSTQPPASWLIAARCHHTANIWVSNGSRNALAPDDMLWIRSHVM